MSETVSSSTTTFIVTRDELDTEKMKNALYGIAKEITRYRSGDLSSCDLDFDIVNYKTKLKMERKKIQHLKENLTTACKIAKNVIAARKIESQTYNQHLDMAKGESILLQKKNSECSEVINKVMLENQTLTLKLQTLSNFIGLGYKELHKMRQEEVKDISTEAQLKEIMIGCGQYYADYCNEREKSNHLEQKNRYLANKMSILEANLNSITEELSALKKLHKTVGVAGEDKENKKRSGSHRVGHVPSEFQFGSEVNIAPLSLTSSTVDSARNLDEAGTKFDALDLSSHISIVQNLLSDQDEMLEDLKKISEQFSPDHDLKLT